jgi:hypothetical protein
MNEYIVVHPGGAHLDEILATGLICRERGVMPVYRREPTEEELADPEVWVVDVGNRHEPDHRNFDHHQLDSPGHPECAFSLVARHLDLHELLGSRPWYAAQIEIDVHGADQLAKDLGLGRTPPREFVSPLETALRHLWGAEAEGEVDAELVRAATTVASGLVDEALAFRKVEEVRQTTQVRRIQGVPILWHETAVSNEVSEHLRHEWQAEHLEPIAASVSRDTRPPHGWALYRFGDDPRIDFGRIEGDPRLSFVHSKGFIAKTVPDVSRKDIEELLGASSRQDP